MNIIHLRTEVAFKKTISSCTKTFCMTTTIWPGNQVWPLWQKIIFRFFFIYFIIYTAPWTWINRIPGSWAQNVLQYYYQFMDWCVNTANNGIFHLYKTLIPFNGSGDTSFGWTQLLLFFLFAFTGCIIWSLLDIKRNNYNRLSYWLRIVVRYFVIINCFGYGIIKIFGLQMSFPLLSQMATPLGDFLPMRFSWMFMGYSLPYQSFSGFMEVTAGLLLLFRRTTTFGALVASGVFINVMIMNLSYDIPVKLFSTHLVVMCFVLLVYDYNRVFAFIFNRAVMQCNLYSVSFSKKWMRISKLILKLGFIIVIVILPFKNSWTSYQQVHNRKETKPFKAGMYEVRKFVKNKDTIPYTYSDSLRWQEIIFENDGRRGSIKTTDTMFWQRYRRGYFTYTTDTVNHTIEVKRTNFVMGENIFLFRLNYNMPDSNTIRMFGAIRKDSVFVELVKTNRRFQLSERQFHWLSEYNR